jgi:GH24 family phage-related lysozyme (muramidase)
MDRQAIQNQLAIDEGKSLNVYRDSKELPTVGIGHLILPADNLHIGDSITDAQCDAFFQSDLDTAIAGAKTIFPDLDNLPEPVQDSIVNMTFNMGVNRLSGFKHFIAAVNIGDWQEAADQLIQSAWYNQVGIRAKRIVAAVLSCINN